MKLQIPSLEYPFNLKMSPHANLLEEKVTLWIDEYICLSEPLRKKHKKSNFGVLTANVFPNTSFELLVPIGRWMFIGFAFDDFYGSQSLDILKEASQKAIHVLEGKMPEIEDFEFFKQLASVRQELLPMVTSYWMERFINHHRVWFEGMEIETLYNNADIKYPLIKEYIVIREKVVGSGIMCDLLEIASDFMMPQEVFTNPLIRKVRLLITLIMSWFNDIYSAERELKRGETMNLVLVIKNERKCSIEEAYKEAIQIHNNDLEEFIKITQNLPDFGKYNEDVKRYIRNAELFLKGQETWYFGGTERYSPKEAQ